MKVLVFNCRKVLEINCRKLLDFACFLHLYRYADFLNRICPTRNYYDFEDEYARQQERNGWY